MLHLHITSLNHSAVCVTDIARSKRFYGGVLGLREIPRPAFPFDGAWYELADGRQFHLIVHDRPLTLRGTTEVDPRDGHLAFGVDDFDRALTVDSGDGDPAYRKGVELIHGKLHDLLAKYGVRPIEALGADFDPNVHQAVVHEASPEHREGEVIGELRKGYMINDRLLRPAMVKVAKA